MSVRQMFMSLYQGLKVLGVLVTLAGGIVLLLNWIATWDKLTAEIEHGPFLIPQSLHEEFDRLDVLTDSDSLLAGFNARWPLAGFTSEGADKLSRYLSDALPRGTPRNIDELRGYWKAAVRNDGSTTLQDVTITLPHTTYVSIAAPGQEVVNRASGPVIPLGVLRPKSSLTVVSWTSWMSPYEAENIQITHAHGTGSVQIKVPVGRFGQWFEGAWGFLTFSVGVWWLWLPLLLLWVMSIIERARKAMKDRSEASQPAPE